MSYTPPANPQPYLPGVSWVTKAASSPVASLSDINSVASTASATQAQVSGDNAPLRVLYGRPRIGAQVPTVLTYQGNLIMLLVWGEGEIEQIESVTVGDAVLPAGITLTHYNGTAGQTADPTLVAAFAAQGITYADNLPGIAYTVAEVPPNITSGFPVFQAIIKGLKILDYRTGLTAWSDNPALATADFETSTVYGRRRTVNVASVIASANHCDELCGTEKRRIIDLAIDNVSPSEQWMEALRTYAGCFLSQEGGETLLIPDKPGAVEMSFGYSVAPKIKKITKLQKKGIRQIPTVMEVRYTDTSVLPWAEKSAWSYAAGVLAGTTPRRPAQVSLLGITRYSQACREADERRKKLELSDLYVEFAAFDEALKVQVGMIIDLTEPNYGLTAKQARVMDAQISEPGRWAIAALEYDPAAYSNAQVAAPTYVDTLLPDPASPPAVTLNPLAEEVFQMENGTWSSRFRITWSAATYPYLAYYRVELWAGATLIHAGRADDAVWPTPAIQEGVIYTAKVASVSSIGSTGIWATQAALAQGKMLIPGDVASISGFEAGGTSYFAWPKAIDIDVWRYELKYGPVGGTYAAATLLDLVDGLRYQTEIIPPGTWTVHVKAVDSVRQLSTNAATCSITVTLDANSFLISIYDQTNPTVVNMAEYRLAPTDPSRYWVTDDGVPWDTKFSAAMDSYTSPLATYHNSVAGAWRGEAEDFGLLLSGTWTGNADTTILTGNPSSHIELSDDTVVWNTSPTTSAKDKARFARLFHQSNGTDTLGVKMGTQQVKLAAIPRSEVCPVASPATSSASGPVTLTMAHAYVKATNIGITLLGTTAASYKVDNIIVGATTSFDVYVFDVVGNKIACQFLWKFDGVY